MEEMTINVGGAAKTFARRALRPPSAGVHGTLLIPTGATPIAGVLVIGGSGGSEPTYVAEGLALEGFAALSIAYFARSGLPATLSRIDLEYFGRALHALRAELPAVVPLALIGMSRGSEAALLTAIHVAPPVAGVVVSVPGNVIAGGVPDGPAWLLDGRPLAWAGRPGPSYDPDPIIPVEKVPGPIMLISAGADAVWPSAPMARAISERLDHHGDTHGHALHEYSAASHSLGYLIPALPPGLLPDGLADDEPTRRSRSDAWPRVIEFLRRLPTGDSM